MAFEVFKETYAGAIKEITLGRGDKAVTVGGETCYPFYAFEGKMPHKPKIAMELWDMEPEDWPESALLPFKDVVSDPAAWAKKCVEQYGADMIALQLKSTDPNSKDASAEAAAATVKKVLEAVEVPVIVWGTANVQKDEEVLKKVAEYCQGANLALGPVEDKNHKGIGASAMGFGHTVIASSPIDVNLAKQINILLENLGMPMDRMIIDPTTGGLGYGLEYSYSVMERIRMAALAQGDDKLQLPIINNLANEIWKCKEAKESAEAAPTLGDPEKRGVLMETVGAVSYLMAGSDILIMRHPESVRLVRAFIDLACDGGMALDVAPVEKRLKPVVVDLEALSPQPDLSIEEEKPKKAPPAKKAVPKPQPAKPAVEKKKAPEPEPKVAAVKAAEKEKPAVEKAEAAAAKAEAEAEAKARAEAEAEAKAKAEEEAKIKAEEEARRKAEEELRAAAEAQAKAEAEARAKREAEEAAIREKRRKEREELARKRKAIAEPKPQAAVSKDPLERMLARLNRIHRRAA
ncbi:MAG: acetyl-CoA decarbonylase/synthase complex subunit delta [Deltaproteobacteria bacterium]|nr:acetyl-CoA decarbonylase/synthase complex subunit delta [Deltaproteobacteria bacterium]MBW2150797.1 acetyl-CoA decarbonylase/synthase complex subunit delta [Deltaproteobacteria bacterium]